MDTFFDFKKYLYSYDGNTIEGMVFGEDDYRCRLDEAEILFILREPDSEDKPADSFWISDVFKAYENPDVKRFDTTTADYKVRRKNNIAAKKYYNRFMEIVDCEKKAVKQIAFCNVHPEKGNVSVGPEYKNADFARILEIVTHLPEDCIIVTVNDVYKKLLAKGIPSYRLRKMYHPSYYKASEKSYKEMNNLK